MQTRILIQSIALIVFSVYSWLHLPMYVNYLPIGALLWGGALITAWLYNIFEIAGIVNYARLVRFDLKCIDRQISMGQLLSLPRLPIDELNARIEYIRERDLSIEDALKLLK